MKIGLFTDTYFPTTNGITYVVSILQKNIEALGHEAYIVAPEPRARHWFKKREHHVIRFPAVEGLFFEEQLTSFFFPSRQLKKITELNLDVIIIFTPAQVGLMGAYSALQNNIPLVEQYSTDLIEYVKRYPAVLPGVFALMLSSPVSLRVKPRELAGLTKSLSVKRDKSLTFSQDTVKHMLDLLHRRCNLVVAVSEKSALQLRKYDKKVAVTTIPTGVDKLPSTKKDTAMWRRKMHAKDGDIVFLYAGRLSKEKNIELLLVAFSKIADTHENVRLAIAGGFSHEAALKDLASTSKHHERIHFIGKIPRDRLGSVYAAADVFCFPSLTDTQALVINEAAHSELPIIWCDNNLNEVAVDGLSGILSKPNSKSFADAMSALASNHKLRRKYGKDAFKRASKITEKKQTATLLRELSKLRNPTEIPSDKPPKLA